jgi:DNA-binding transcriptional LysR family regulator
MSGAGWRGLEVRNLAALVAVGRDASFSRAAEALGYTQSAVSHQISALERAVGRRLVERPGGTRPVTLTAAGVVLLEHAEAVVSRLRSAQAALEALDGARVGKLRTGSFGSVGGRLVPPVLRRFRERWPDVTVELTESQNDGELLALLADGALDLTFVSFPLEDGPFTAVELLREPHVMAVSSGSPLARLDAAPSLQALTELPLIGYQTIREAHWIEQRLGGDWVARRVAYRSNDTTTILGLVAEDLGVAVVPWLLDQARPDVTALPLPGLAPRTVGLVWHRDRPLGEAAQTFIELAREVGGELQQLANAAWPPERREGSMRNFDGATHQSDLPGDGDGRTVVDDDDRTGTLPGPGSGPARR